MSLDHITITHLHHLVQELGIGHRVALDAQHLLERVHLDAAVGDLLDESLEAVPQSGSPLRNIRVRRLSLLSRASCEPDSVRCVCR